jgi:hypothetical protein
MYATIQAAAAQRGWKLEPPNPGLHNLYSSVALSGAESGVPVRIEYVAGAQSFTTIAALDPPIPIHFAITHEGFIGTLKHLVGFRDVEVGDAAFDKAFRVVSKDGDAVRKLLTPEVREALTKLYAATNPLGMRAFHVSEHGVSLTRVTAPDVIDAKGLDDLLADLPVTLAVVHALRHASTS